MGPIQSVFLMAYNVTVIALAGHPLWQSEHGLKVGGPAAFG